MGVNLCCSQGGSSTLTSNQSNLLADCGSASAVKRINRLHINCAFHRFKQQGFNATLLDRMKDTLYQEMGKDTGLRLDRALSMIGGFEDAKLKPQLRQLIIEQLVKEAS